MGLTDDRDDLGPESLEFNDYQEWTAETAVYPGKPASREAITYCALGLASEAGEVAGKMKKILRDGDTDKLRDGLLDELGDVLWYAARLADEMGRSLSSVAEMNIDKLNGRAERGTLQGSGDTR